MGVQFEHALDGREYRRAQVLRSLLIRLGNGNALPDESVGGPVDEIKANTDSFANEHANCLTNK